MFAACGLWQFEHFLSLVTASCCTRLFAIWFLMPAWHFRQRETISSPSRAGSTELWALWQSVHASTAGTCLYLRAMMSRTSSWQEKHSSFTLSCLIGPGVRRVVVDVADAALSALVGGVGAGRHLLRHRRDRHAAPDLGLVHLRLDRRGERPIGHEENRHRCERRQHPQPLEHIRSAPGAPGRPRPPRDPCKSDHSASRGGMTLIAGKARRNSSPAVARHITVGECGSGPHLVTAAASASARCGGCGSPRRGRRSRGGSSDPCAPVYRW